MVEWDWLLACRFQLDRLEAYPALSYPRSFAVVVAFLRDMLEQPDLVLQCWTDAVVEAHSSRLIRRADDPMDQFQIDPGHWETFQRGVGKFQTNTLHIVVVGLFAKVLHAEICFGRPVVMPLVQECLTQMAESWKRGQLDRFKIAALQRQQHHVVTELNRLNSGFTPKPGCFYQPGSPGVDTGSREQARANQNGDHARPCLRAEVNAWIVVFVGMSIDRRRRASLGGSGGRYGKGLGQVGFQK